MLPRNELIATAEGHRFTNGRVPIAAAILVTTGFDRLVAFFRIPVDWLIRSTSQRGF
jgi:hypothetical protein